MVKNQNWLIWIQTVSLYTKKKIIFIKTLQKMLKLDLILQNMTQTCHNKNVIGLMKDGLGRKIMNTYSYLIDDGSEDKKGKGKKNCIIKRKLKFENYKSCLEAIELDNKINYLEKIKLTQITSFATKENIQGS